YVSSGTESASKTGPSGGGGASWHQCDSAPRARQQRWRGEITLLLNSSNWTSSPAAACRPALFAEGSYEVRGLHTTKGFRTLLLASCVTGFALTTPAVAQSADGDEEGASSQQIIVTGSRIARPDYVANSPTITVDEEFLRQSS